MSAKDVVITIHFNDLALEPEEQDGEVQNLLNQLKAMDEVEEVKRAVDPNPPLGSKPGAAFLLGMLTTEVNFKNARTVFNFLSERLSGKTIEMEVEANGKKFKVKASSQMELQAALEAAQKFVAA